MKDADIEKGKMAKSNLRKSAASYRVLIMRSGRPSAGNVNGDSRVGGGVEIEDQNLDTPFCKRRRKTLVVDQINDDPVRFVKSARDIKIANVNPRSKCCAFEECFHENLMHERAEQRRHDAKQRKKRDAANIMCLKAMLLFAV